jgi:hypothetical protein
MTFDDVRKLALAWPEVEDGTSYGTPALKVRKKLLARLKEDGDSLVMPGVPQDGATCWWRASQSFLFTDHYRDFPMVLIRLSKANPLSSSRCCAALAHARFKGGAEFDSPQKHDRGVRL